MEIVDTHAHIYHPDEAAYPMVDDALRTPARTGSIEHLRKEAREAGVGRVVLVQTSSAYGWDNRLLADTAAANRDWTAGVCTLDPASPETPQELERLMSEHNVRGFRVLPTGERYPLLYQPGAVRIWETVRSLGAVVCAHIRANFLRQLSDLLARFPEVPVVLDHAAYLKVAEGVQSETVQGVLDLSRFRNLSVKLTFAVSASEEAYPFRDVHPIIRELVDGFGPERCMWGSAFPCELWFKKASYAQHLALFAEELGLTEGEKQATLEETPTRIWFG